MFKHFPAILCILLLALPARAEQVVTRYLSVDLPEGWKVVMPPTESQAYSTAIFSNLAGNATVGFVAGPNGGTDAKTIAEMFARQFNASRTPTERNGQSTFLFTQQGSVHQAWVAVAGDAFLLTTLSGDRKEGLAFVRKFVQSRDFPDLLPR